MCVILNPDLRVLGGRDGHWWEGVLSAVAVCDGIELKFPLCSEFYSGIMFFERVVHKVEAAVSESDVFVRS